MTTKTRRRYDLNDLAVVVGGLMVGIGSAIIHPALPLIVLGLMLVLIGVR